MPLFEESKELRDFRQVFKKFVAREVTPHFEEWEKNRGVPRELWKKMGKQGFLAPWLPEEYGGSNLDFRYSVVIGEELVRGDGAAVGVPLSSDVATPYIYSYGSEELKKRILPRVTTGDVICAVGFTEPNAGSDLAAIRTKAVRDGDHFIINGQKTFITNGTFADVVVTACKIESDSKDPKASKNISLIAVEADSPGFHRGRQLEKMGRHMQDSSELFYEDCRVPVSNLIGKEGEGFKYMMQKLCQERLEVCNKIITYAEECFNEGVKYSKEREAFGKLIGDHQANGFKIAQMATEVEIGRTFFNVLLEDFVKGQDITMKVSMAKAWLGEMLQRTAYQALQLHGGYGYCEEYRICRLFRECRSLSIFAGTTEIMNVIIARRLGFKGM